MTKAIKEAQKYVEDFPSTYNAHEDRLTDSWEHKETVNKLLGHLRAVLEHVSKQKRK